jgi:hypothetical protein
MFYPYIAPALLEEMGNMDIYGYMTQYFQLCPGAQMLFKDLIQVEGVDEIKEAVIAAAMLADRVFQIEDEVLKAQKANANQFVDAYNYVEEFDNVLDAIEEYLDIDIDEDFMENHLMTIKSLLPTELQEFEQGPCQNGYVQIGVKEKDGRIVPNCVPEDKVG